MKLLVGKVLIETDHIEMVEKLSNHIAKIYFVSGNVIEVVCGARGTAFGIWDQDVDDFIETLQHTDTLRLTEKSTLNKS